MIKAGKQQKSCDSLETQVTYTLNTISSHHTPLRLSHSFIPLACAECDNSLPFSGHSSIPLCYIPFPSALLHQLFFHGLSLNLAIYFLVYPSIFTFPNSYMIFFWEFYFLPLSVPVQTNVSCITLLSLLW
jgi:hypothetical protein